MPVEAPYQDEELRPLNRDDYSDQPGNSIELRSSPSTTSLVLENIHGSSANGDGDIKRPPPGTDGSDSSVEFPKPDADLEDGSVLDSRRSKKARKWSLFWILGGAFTGCWLLVLIYVIVQRYGSSAPSTGWSSAKKPVTLDQVLSGQWRPARQHIEWIEGVNGEDGLLLERDSSLADEYLVVKDVRKRSGEGDDDEKFRETQTLMKVGWFEVDGRRIFPSDVWPSRDLKKVLIISDKTSNWRHSYNGTYWLLEVATQTAEPLDPSMPDAPIQLARWSPKSDSVAFVRDNNLFLRKLSSVHVVQITRDGGAELFYGVPDWVYEEEVFSGNSAMWWAEDGAYLAFLRTNESLVPDYPIQYFVSRPSGERPPKGLENYPEIREIKYPKSGAPNPVVDMQFYDVSRDEVFDVAVEGDFPDEDRLITEVVWAGSSGRVLVRETNRESDILRISLVDVHFRSGRVIRTEDVNALDQGWFEVSQDTQYVPADPARGRPDDGYIDTVIHDGYDHLAYYSPLENADPTILTSGTWEVVSAPAAVDLTNNLVYFVATKESPTQRHLYSVKLDGTGLSAVTEASKEGYYEASFSKGAGYALLTYNGPEIPWQEVISTPSNPDQYVEVIEENAQLRDLAAQHDLPVEIYQNVTIDGYTLQVVERRPPHFDPRKKYPVLFHLYGGPGSQTVNKKFTVDFQAYVASNLGYVVVTVDGRGTGFIGRKARCIVRGNIGHYEAHDQIETAKIWARKSYVDEERIAIWGWSYGGFLTLKTIEVDAGRTFSYGMAVAPVTDWKFYDSIYTERYMHTPQHNPTGYTNASISDMQGLQSNVRFLFMHGVADDNVHMQNSLTLLDKLDLAGVENYDVHVFPDSDHSIYFHNANRIVYDRLSNWLINAFNGEWLRTQHASPDKNYRHPGHGLSDTAPQRQGQDQGQEGHYNDDGGHAFKRDLHDIIAVADYSSPL